MGSQQRDRKGYDRGATIFNPNGRIYQVEYAREAVNRGGLSVGITTSESVILAVEKASDSELLLEESIEKIHMVNDNIAIAASGHVADTRQLVEYARVEVQRDYYQYEEPILVETLAESIGDYIQEQTQTGGTRPFGCALLIGGVDETGPKLIEADPSGAIIGYKATGIGEGKENVMEKLEKDYKEDMTTEDGIKLVLKAMLDEDTSIENIECFVIKEDSVNELSTDDIKEYSPE